MPTSETMERFIARVEQGAHAEAIEEFYLENGAIRENQAPPRRGRANLVARERQVLARARTVQTTCIRPVFVSGSNAVVRWIFRFEWLDGSVTQMEELAYQRWQGERIVEEQFFYDPAQRTPSEAGPARSEPAAAPVQRQLDAYNAHDLERFVAEYSDEIQVFRPPVVEPVLSGKTAFAEHYSKNRFTLPRLHAEVVSRMVAGAIVVDHERITGLQEGVVEAVAVYRVAEGRICTVWFY